MKKTLIAAASLILLTPSIALAAWWNPITWFGSNATKPQFTNTTSTSTPAPDLQTQINTLKSENNSLESQLLSTQNKLTSIQAQYASCKTSLATQSNTTPISSSDSVSPSNVMPAPPVVSNINNSTFQISTQAAPSCNGEAYINNNCITIPASSANDEVYPISLLTSAFLPLSTSTVSGSKVPVFEFALRNVSKEDYYYWSGALINPLVIHLDSSGSGTMGVAYLYGFGTDGTEQELDAAVVNNNTATFQNTQLSINGVGTTLIIKVDTSGSLIITPSVDLSESKFGNSFVGVGSVSGTPITVTAQ